MDLDIEDEYFFSHGPPNQAMTTCVDAIANAGHAAGLYVSADVITNWGGGWWAPSAGNIDQFNLMTFGDDLATMQQDVQATIQQGLPASKFVVGVDVSEHPTAARWLRAVCGLRGAGRSDGGVRLGGPRRLLRGNICGRSRLRRTVTRRRHAVTALVLLGLLLGTGTGAAKVSRAPKNRSAPRVSGSPVRRSDAGRLAWALDA